MKNIRNFSDVSVLEKLFAADIPEYNDDCGKEDTVVITRDRDAFSGGRISSTLSPLEKTVGRAEIKDAIKAFNAETFITNRYGYLPSSMTRTNATISREDHQNVLLSLALMTIDMRKDRVLGEKEKLKVTFHMYAYALCMYLNMQAIQRNRDFFLKNSRETMFSQTALYQHRADEAEAAADKLNRELAEANERINRLLEQLDQKPSKTTNEKVYLEEIASLNKTIREQNEVIAEWERKGAELNALRELAYLSDTDEDPVVEDTDAARESLSQMLRTTSVYVIGGHPTWRKRIKAEYPKLNVVDSLANTVDFSGLRDADLVVFNTQYMSHSLGEKVCADLGERRIPLVFLSRGSNTAKHTKEILMAIEKNLGKSA